MNLQQALEQLCQPVRRRDYPRSLATMQALLRALGEPQRSLTAVTITGSSGKSSVCHQLATLLQAQGLRCGCYLSPHMHSFRERFLLDGAIIGVGDFCAGATIVSEAAHSLPGPVSSFERSTALALWWFRQQGAQVVVLETGLGGRYDAVNALGNCLALFTGIEAEHTALLGGDLTGVAWHKAGIMQPGGQAISVPQEPAVRKILQDEAARVSARLHFTDEPLADAAQASLVERGLVPATPAAAAAQTTFLPGRLEAVTLPAGPPLLIDGGHTAMAARLLRANYRKSDQDDRRWLRAAGRRFPGRQGRRGLAAGLRRPALPHHAHPRARPPGGRAAASAGAVPAAAGAGHARTGAGARAAGGTSD